MTIASGLLQVAGLLAVAAGLFLVYPPAGIVAFGLGSFGLGIVLGLPPRSPK